MGQWVRAEPGARWSRVAANGGAEGKLRLRAPTQRAPSQIGLSSSATTRKRGRGMYRYGGRSGTERLPDREFWRTIGPAAPSGALPSAADALDRLLVVMLDEAARCLDEGVVTSAEALDWALVAAFGFPPFRGGLLQYTDERGLPALLDRLRGFETELGPRFSPSERLVRMVAHGESFFAAAQDGVPSGLAARD